MPRRKQRRLIPAIPSLLLAALLISGFACGSDTPQTAFSHESGMAFRFPEGWSVPSPREWRELKLGEDQTLLTIMDETRTAGFSIIPVNLDADEEFVLNILDDDPAARAVMLTESIDAAGPQRYEEYALIDKRPALFAGAFMGEIVYEGRNPGKELNRYRLLALTTTRDAIIMFVFSAPVDQYESFQDDFDFIENTWDWGN